jgi:hypothetical protein
MSRGPGRIERTIENALRSTDRSYSIEELALIAYPGINDVQKKHEVSVLRASKNAAKRIKVWRFTTYQAPWRSYLSNLNSVRSFSHAYLRACHLATELNLTAAQIDSLLDTKDGMKLMQPGNYLWLEAEISKVESQYRERLRQLGIDDGSPYVATDELRSALAELNDLRVHKRDGAPWYLEIDDLVLGRYAPDRLKYLGNWKAKYCVGPSGAQTSFAQ